MSIDYVNPAMDVSRMLSIVHDPNLTINAYPGIKHFLSFSSESNSFDCLLPCIISLSQYLNVGFSFIETIHKSVPLPIYQWLETPYGFFFVEKREKWSCDLWVWKLERVAYGKKKIMM